MNQKRHSILPFGGLSGWGHILNRHTPLPGQRTLFRMDIQEGTSDPVGHPELFETGRDLPGASERSQRILWDVE